MAPLTKLHDAVWREFITFTKFLGSNLANVVNLHALAPLTNLHDFRVVAGDGCYPEGDFDNSGLQRNIEARGCFFEQLHGADYEEAMRQVNPQGLLGIFYGAHALGCIIHMPHPRHWIALVPPVEQKTIEPTGGGSRGSPERHGAAIAVARPVQQQTAHVAALLCDSLQPQPYAVSVDDMVDLFTTMGLRHRQYAYMGLPSFVREQLAAGWSAYRVTR